MSEQHQQDNQEGVDIGIGEHEESGESIEASLVLRESKPLTIPQKKRRKTIRENKFGDSIIIRREDGSKIFVPNAAEDNRSANMVVATMLRDLVKSNIDIYKNSGCALKPKELSDLASAAKAAAEMSYKAYELGEGGVPNAGSSPQENGLLGGMRAIGEGMGRAIAQQPSGFAAIVAELDKLGKRPREKKVEVEVIEEDKQQ